MKKTRLPETVFDYRNVKQRLLADDDFIKLIVDTYILHFPNQLKSLQDAFYKSDAPLVKRHAHTIKGASANAGALILQHHCAAIESLAENGDLVAIKPILEQLPKYFSSFQCEYQTKLT